METVFGQLDLFDSAKMTMAFQQVLPDLVLDTAIDAIIELPFVECGWAEPQSSELQTTHELATVAHDRSQFDRNLPRVDVDVVVIALEADSATTELSGEGMQLVEMTVGDQVTPGRVAPTPPSLINENRHQITVRRCSMNHAFRDHPQTASWLAHSKV